jgi:hypothetical protein
MNAIARSIARTRRRLLLLATFNLLGLSLLAAVVAATLLLLCDRLLALSAPWWLYLAVAILALLLPPIIALTRRPSAHAVACLLDDRLHLQDRLATALFAQSLPDDPLARQVIDEAQSTAATIRVANAVPLHFGRIWSWTLSSAAVLALLGVFLSPHLDPFGLRARQAQQQARDDQATAAQHNIIEAKALIREIDSAQADLPEADPKDLMRDLASLTDRDLANPDLAAKTMAKLTQVQDKLAQSQQAKQQEFRSLQNQMSQLDPKTPGPADRFAQALRRGDFLAAQRELEQLAQQVDSGQLSDADKELLKQQLQNMSDQLQQLAAQQAQSQQQTQQQIQQQLQQAGLSQQQIQQLQQQNYNPQAVQQALQQAYQQQGMSQQQAQQQAQQTAQQVSQQQQQSQQAGQCSSCSNGMSQSMSQMAQTLSQQGQQTQQAPQGQQGQPGQQGQQGQQAQGQPGQQGQQGSPFSASAWQGQQQLSQMAQMQQQLQQMGMAQSQLQSAMQQLSASGAGHKPGAASAGKPGSGVGGQGAGVGDGGNPLGMERQYGPYQSEAQGDIQDRQGRIIASWMQSGENASGDATVQFDHAVTSARDDAERAVTEDRVPRRYHEAIRQYFNQLPQSPDAVRGAPPAPR